MISRVEATAREVGAGRGGEINIVLDPEANTMRARCPLRYRLFDVARVYLYPNPPRYPRRFSANASTYVTGTSNHPEGKRFVNEKKNLFSSVSSKRCRAEARAPCSPREKKEPRLINRPFN